MSASKPGSRVVDPISEPAREDKLDSEGSGSGHHLGVSWRLSYSKPAITVEG